jgi:hypothetical protein
LARAVRPRRGKEQAAAVFRSAVRVLFIIVYVCGLDLFELLDLNPGAVIGYSSGHKREAQPTERHNNSGYFAAC